MNGIKNFLIKFRGAIIGGIIGIIVGGVYLIGLL